MPPDAVPLSDLPEHLVPENDLPAPQKKSGFPERAAAFGYGALTGTLGAPGDIEELVSQTIPKWLGASKPLYDASTVIGDKSKTFLPTTEQVRQTGEAMGIPRPGKDVSGYETAGEIAPALLAVPRLAQKGVRLLAGETSRIGEESAKAAEKLGFKLSAPQVARATPKTQRGAAGFEKANQQLANRYASAATGKVSDFVDEKFLKGRIKDLGKSFDKVYQGKQFNIDPSAVQAISTILANEHAALGASGVSAVRSAAEDIMRNYQALTSSGTAIPATFAIDGTALQRLRNALTARAGAAGGQTAHEIYGLVDEIDASVARNHPNVAAELNVLRPQYRAAVVLEDLTKAGGINRGDVSLAKLGDMLEGTSIRRKAEHGIDVLGKVGRDNNLIALWEKPGEAIGEEGKSAMSLADALGAGWLGRGLTLPARTRPVRAAQRFMGTPAVSTTGRFMRGQLGGALNQLLPGGAAARATKGDGQ